MTSSVIPDRGVGQLDTIELCGLQLETGTLELVSAWFSTSIGVRRVAPADVVAHINAANCYRLLHDPAMAEALQASGHLLLDGIGMRVGARIVGLGRQPAINGTDLFPLIMDRLDEAGARIYLFGGRDGIVDLAAAKIQQTWPGVRVVGIHHGFPEDQEAVCSLIAAAKPDLVLVGLGFGIQERFALDHRHHLAGTVLWMVGGLFDFVSGATPRAPAWMRRANLEWLFRLGLEPRRMFWRNAVAAPLFLLACIRHRAPGAPGRSA